MSESDGKSNIFNLSHKQEVKENLLNGALVTVPAVEEGERPTFCKHFLSLAVTSLEKEMKGNLPKGTKQKLTDVNLSQLYSEMKS